MLNVNFLVAVVSFAQPASCACVTPKEAAAEEGAIHLQASCNQGGCKCPHCCYPHGAGSGNCHCCLCGKLSKRERGGGNWPSARTSGFPPAFAIGYVQRPRPLKGLRRWAPAGAKNAHCGALDVEVQMQPAGAGTPVAPGFTAGPMPRPEFEWCQAL